MRAPFLVLASAAACLALLSALSGGCSDRVPTTGPELFRAWGCSSCHGENGMGLPGLGPNLWGKHVHWTPAKLREYLRDPVGYASRDPRLREQGRDYATPMPPLLVQDEERVQRVIEHVLSLR